MRHQRETRRAANSSVPFRKSFLGVLFLALTVLTVLLLLYAGFGRRVVANQGLVIAEEDLDLGEVWLADSIATTLQLTNPTRKDIAIVDFRSSCSCTSITPRFLVVPARGRASIDVVFDVTPRVSDADRSRVSYTAHIVPIFPEYVGPQPGWRIRCLVRNAFSVTPRVLTFGGAEAVSPGKEPISKSLLVKCNYPGVSIAADVEPGLGDVAVRCLSDDEASSKWSVSLTPASTLPVGPFDSAMQLTATNARGDNVGHAVVSVRGEVVFDIDALPTVVRLGACQLKTVSDQQLVIRSRTGQVFDVGEPQTESGWLHVRRVSTGVDESHAFDIVADICLPGFQSGSITFPISGRDICLRVQVTYFGIE